MNRTCRQQLPVAVEELAALGLESDPAFLAGSAWCSAVECGSQVWSTGRKRRWKQRGKQKQGWFSGLEKVSKNE